MSAVPSSNVNLTTEVTLFSKTLPGGLVGPNDYLDIMTRWSYTNAATNKTLRVKIGTSVYMAHVATTTASCVRHVNINFRNSTASQVVTGVNQSTDSGVSATPVATFTEDLSVDKTFAITGQNANVATTITLESFWAILWKNQP